MRHINIQVPSVEQYFNPATFRWEPRKVTKDAQVLASNSGSDAARVLADAERQNIIADAVIRLKNIPKNLGIIAWWQRIIFVMALHNAMQLTTSMVQSVGDLMSLTLDFIGIEGEDDTPIDVNELVKEGLEDLLEKALGEERYKNTKTWLAATNKIYQSGANILNTINSISDSSRSLAEFTGNNVSRIGNALKKFGVIGENAYKFMSEQVTATTARQRKLDSYLEGLEKVDETVGALNQVVSDGHNIQQELEELGKNREEFKKSVEDLPPGNPLENKPIKEAADAEKAVSVFPDGEVDLNPAA